MDFSVIRKWAIEHDFQLALFNISLILLVLLRSAGYFEPFFLITINLIVLSALILSITLLQVSSRFLFAISLIFWIFAGFLEVVGVNIWAERTVIYCYEALFVGIILLAYESSDLKKIAWLKLIEKLKLVKK